MAANRYPEGMVDWIKANYINLTLPELTEICNDIFKTNLSKKAMSSLKKKIWPHRSSEGEGIQWNIPGGDLLLYRGKLPGHRASTNGRSHPEGIWPGIYCSADQIILCQS